MRDRHWALREAVAAEVRAEIARHSSSGVALARALNMSQSALARRLSGDMPFNIDELDAIARHFDVPITDLLGGDRYRGGRAKGALLNSAGQAA